MSEARGRGGPGPSSRFPAGDSAERAPVVWDAYAEALPGVARIAADSTGRAAAWGMRSGLRSGRLLARALTDPATAGELVQHVAKDVAEASRTISDVARAVGDGMPLSKALLEGSLAIGAAILPPEQPVVEPEPSLRERGEELLHQSRDVWRDRRDHPAYARILEDLAPDEARILLLLLHNGPEPSVDVRTGGPVGMVSSTLLAGGLNMIGPRAGCRYVEDVPAYLDNLHRLGLVWFSREQLDDPMDYQVVEAQPDVLAAMRSVRFSKLVRRSIHLTPFGTNFCTTVLVDADAAGTAALPRHQVPGDEQADLH